MANQNGRNVAAPDENRPSWRPQDENGQRNRRIREDDDDRYTSRDRDDRYMRGWEDRSSRMDRDDSYRVIERGQGQSDYDAGRCENERSTYWGDRESRDSGYGDQQMGYGNEDWGNEGYSPSRRGQRDRDMYQQARMQQGFSRQSHRGKGPAGYARSDERVHELVCEALTEDHNVDATNIDATVKDGEVILSGTVEDRMQKRMAEDCVFQIAGVKDVQNQLRVATGRRTRNEGSNGSSKETEPSTSSTNDKRHRA